MQILYFSQHTVGGFQIFQLQRNFDRLRHAAPDYEDLALVFDGGIDNLLHARDQRSKGGDNHPSFSMGDDILQRFPDYLFGRGITGNFGIGGIGKEQQNAL